MANIYRDMISKHPEHVETMAEGSKRVLNKNNHAMLIFKDYFVHNLMVMKLFLCVL